MSLIPHMGGNTRMKDEKRHESVAGKRLHTWQKNSSSWYHV